MPAANDGPAASIQLAVGNFQEQEGNGLGAQEISAAAGSGNVALLAECILRGAEIDIPGEVRRR